MGVVGVGIAGTLTGRCDRVPAEAALYPEDCTEGLGGVRVGGGGGKSEP